MDSTVQKKLEEEIILEAGKELAIEAKMRIIADTLHRADDRFFWVGFYFPGQNEMKLGPSAGPPACDPISLEGVCGKAALSRKTVIVPDVDNFPGHIACNPHSKSEIVVPVFDSGGELIAVFDADSDRLDSFAQSDGEFLERLMNLVFAG